MNRYIDEIAQLLPIDAAKKLDKLTVLRTAVETIKHLKGKRELHIQKKTTNHFLRHIVKSCINWFW